MIYKCPGQDTRKRSAENIRCRACGYIAEIFSDEVKLKCPKCGNLIYKGRLPSCVDYCKAARECIGEKRWSELSAEGGSACGGKEEA